MLDRDGARFRRRGQARPDEASRAWGEWEGLGGLGAWVGSSPKASAGPAEQTHERSRAPRCVQLTVNSSSQCKWKGPVCLKESRKPREATGRDSARTRSVQEPAAVPGAAVETAQPLPLAQARQGPGRQPTLLRAALSGTWLRPGEAVVLAGRGFAPQGTAALSETIFDCHAWGWTPNYRPFSAPTEPEIHSVEHRLRHRHVPTWSLEQKVESAGQTPQPQRGTLCRRAGQAGWRRGVLAQGTRSEASTEPGRRRCAPRNAPEKTRAKDPAARTRGCWEFPPIVTRALKTGSHTDRCGKRISGRRPWRRKTPLLPGRVSRPRRLSPQSAWASRARGTSL